MIVEITKKEILEMPKCVDWETFARSKGDVPCCAVLVDTREVLERAAFALEFKYEVTKKVPIQD